MTLARPVQLLLEPLGTEPDLLGTLRRRAQRNQALFRDLEGLLERHALPESPALACLAPALKFLLTSTDAPFRPLPAAALPLLL